MKTLENVIVGAFFLVCGMWAMWACGFLTHNETFDGMDLLQILWLNGFNSFLGYTVAVIMLYSWMRGRPYEVGWGHLSIGALAFGSATLSLWLLALLIGITNEILVHLFFWAGSLFLLMGAIILFIWIADPQHRPPPPPRW